ncbi:MAG: fatty acid CoA ligase family protein [Phycisphaerales bacterium]|nr:fatty acid CoA ligase family protein [Phycisphaerales bacterium]
MNVVSHSTPEAVERTEVTSGLAPGLNIASHLPRMAAAAPQQRAVVVSRRRGARLHYASLTFAELEALSNRYANGLTAAGIGRNHRVLLMVRQGFDFVALVFALFKMGAVPVMIDPGMGVNRLLDCVRTVDLDALVGIPLAQAVRVLRPGPFRTIEYGRFITVGRRWFWGGPTLDELSHEASDRFTIADTAADETAAILFTSGSTGPAKGVVYEHGMFDAQVRMIQSCYGIEPGEIDLPTFPLFALFSVAMGMTIVLPDMDPSHPARVRPANIVAAIHDQKVTNTFGSPAVWRRVAAYCVEREIKLPTLRRILIAGAPVPRAVIEQLHLVLSSDADVHTPYGATESLPVSTISGREILVAGANAPSPLEGRGLPEDATGATVMATRFGAGTCVGRPLPGVEVRLIRISDDPIAEMSDDLVVLDGEFGEICVRGPAVTREYFGLPQADATAKIRDGDTIWHRMGDIGCRDAEGRLWFCGRKSHRVTTRDGTLFTECVEPIFNEHPDVSRCALVGVGPPGRQTPVLIVEPKPGRFPRARRVSSFVDELLDLARTANAAEPGASATGPISTATVMERSTAPGASAAGPSEPGAQATGPASRLTKEELQNASPLTKGGHRGVAVPLRGFVAEPALEEWLRGSLDQSTIANRQLGILFHRSLPVDIRHNAKINRERLAVWATRQYRDSHGAVNRTRSDRRKWR